MAVYVVPLAPDESNQEQLTALDGVDFVFRVLWNSRSSRFFMTLRDASGTDLITARKLCADIPWAAHETLEGIPQGQLWVVGATLSGIDPGLRELNRRV